MDFSARSFHTDSMNERIGVYILGACGNVATLSLAGALAISRGLTDSTGLVSAGAEFQRAGLPALADLRFGGCDIAPVSLTRKLRSLANDQRMLPVELPAKIEDDVRAFEAALDVVEPLAKDGGNAASLLAQLTSLLREFAARERCERLVVVNLISTEPMVPSHPAHASEDALRSAIQAGAPGALTFSMLAALASADAGASFVNFTPNPAHEVEGVREASLRAGVNWAGSDGKTGETLIKTVLGPLFVARGFKVRSWLANNYLGNGDGRSLADPNARATKLQSKDHALRSILGPESHLSTDIGYAPSLDDWKTAWDFIHFEGFLGTKMSMQFTWQGCDSTLAAPLVLDLVRLCARAAQQGESGELGWLASFFKSPLGVDEHDFFKQLALLHHRVAVWAESPSPVTGSK